MSDSPIQHGGDARSRDIYFHLLFEIPLLSTTQDLSERWRVVRDLLVSELTRCSSISSTQAQQSVASPAVPVSVNNNIKQDGACASDALPQPQQVLFESGAQALSEIFVHAVVATTRTVLVRRLADDLAGILELWYLVITAACVSLEIFHTTYGPMSSPISGSTGSPGGFHPHHAVFVRETTAALRDFRAAIMTKQIELSSPFFGAGAQGGAASTTSPMLMSSIDAERCVLRWCALVVSHGRIVGNDAPVDSGATTIRADATAWPSWSSRLDAQSDRFATALENFLSRCLSIVERFGGIFVPRRSAEERRRDIGQQVGLVESPVRLLSSSPHSGDNATVVCLSCPETQQAIEDLLTATLRGAPDLLWTRHFDSHFEHLAAFDPETILFHLLDQALPPPRVLGRPLLRPGQIHQRVLRFLATADRLATVVAGGENGVSRPAPPGETSAVFADSTSEQEHQRFGLRHLLLRKAAYVAATQEFSVPARLIGAYIAAALSPASGGIHDAEVCQFARILLHEDQPSNELMHHGTIIDHSWIMEQSWSSGARAHELRLANTIALGLLGPRIWTLLLAELSEAALLRHGNDIFSLVSATSRAAGAGAREENLSDDYKVLLGVSARLLPRLAESFGVVLRACPLHFAGIVERYATLCFATLGSNNEWGRRIAFLIVTSAIRSVYSIEGGGGSARHSHHERNMFQARTRRSSSVAGFHVSFLRSLALVHAFRMGENFEHGILLRACARAAISDSSVQIILGDFLACYQALVEELRSPSSIDARGGGTGGGESIIGTGSVDCSSLFGATADFSAQESGDSIHDGAVPPPVHLHEMDSARGVDVVDRFRPARGVDVVDRFGCILQHALPFPEVVSHPSFLQNQFVWVALFDVITFSARGGQDLAAFAGFVHTAVRTMYRSMLRPPPTHIAAQPAILFDRYVDHSLQHLIPPAAVPFLGAVEAALLYFRSEEAKNPGTLEKIVLRLLELLGKHLEHPRARSTAAVEEAIVSVAVGLARTAWITESELGGLLRNATTERNSSVVDVGTRQVLQTHGEVSKCEFVSQVFEGAQHARI